MAIKTYLLFYKAVLFSLFGAKKENALISDLFNKFSYRYDSDFAKSNWAPFIYFRKSVGLILKRKTNFPDNISWKSVVFESQPKFRTSDMDYLRYNGIEEVNFVFREELPNELGSISRLGMLFFLGTVFICILPLTLFYFDKAKPSLVMLELTENALLYSCLKRMKSKRIFFFSAYEKDAYFTCYLAQSAGFYISIVPSSNPISFFYKRVLCNQFIFTAAFQQLECKHLKEGWNVESTLVWKPFESQSVNLNKGNVRYEFDLGFVSSGMYLREKRSHGNPLGMNDYKAEIALIAAIKNFLSESRKTLIVYLHPFEKSSDENLDLAIAYYKKEFGYDVAFAPFHEPSKMNFHLAEVAVSGFSSAQIERLYGGYKTLFAPMGYLKNYFNDNRLNTISVNNEIELKQSLTKLLNTSDELFFDQNDLGEYHWRSYVNATTKT